MSTSLSHDAKSIEALLDLPMMDLLYRAQSEHRKFFNPNKIQLSTLLSVKTGACPEDCAYCPQSVHYSTGLEREKLMPVETVRLAAAKAKANGASRFCMGLAWRSPPTKKQFSHVLELVKVVAKEGLSTCLSMGMLTKEQAQALETVGLDYYNHNLDTSSEYYKKIISTRTYQDRLDTLQVIQNTEIKTCCGGIVDMGESRADRIQFLLTLLGLQQPPESIPINRLIRIKGTPLEHTESFDDFEFLRMLAVSRILFPQSVIRLSAGRETMDETLQALCFFAGANSIFYGEKLLTAANPTVTKDQALMQKLGMSAASCKEVEDGRAVAATASE
jgi:biotin synthase